MNKFLILFLLFLVWPSVVYGQMSQPAKCPDVVGGVDYCPTMSNSTRCSVYGTSPSCAAKANELQTPSNTNLNCDSCTFSCQSGWADCDGNIQGNGCEKQSQIGQSCTTTGGQSGTYTGNPCSPICTAAPAYVSRQFSDPGTIESGFFYIAGNMKSSAGDLYLANGKAIRVDGSGATSFNVGNWNAGASGFKMNIYGDLGVYSALSVTGETTLNNDTTVKGQMTVKTSIGTNLKVETTSNSATTASQLSLYHGGNNDWAIRNLNGVLQMYDLTSNKERLKINQEGVITVPGTVSIGGSLCLNNVCKANWSEVGGAGAGGGVGDLLSVLQAGADASTFTGDTKIGGSLKINGGAAFGGYEIDKSSSNIILTTPSMFARKALVGFGVVDPGDDGLGVAGNVIIGGTIKTGSTGKQITTTDGSLDWTKLANFPTACSAGQYVSAIGTSLSCGTPAGGAGGTSQWTTSGNNIYYNTGNVGIGTTTPGSLLHLKSDGAAGLKIESTSSDPDSISQLVLTHGGGDDWAINNLGGILQIFNTTAGGERLRLTPGGDLTVSGCFGPAFVGMTNNSYDSNQGGYYSVNNLCKNAYSGSHVCTTVEMLNSINCGKNLSAIGNESSGIWVTNGAPSLPTPTNDCQGWTTNDSSWKGIHYVYDNNGGKFYAKECSAALKIACCK